MQTIKATNQETGEIRTYKVGAASATVTDNRGGRRETTPESALAEAYRLEWPWVRT